MTAGDLKILLSVQHDNRGGSIRFARIEAWKEIPMSGIFPPWIRVPVARWLGLAPPRFPAGSAAEQGRPLEERPHVLFIQAKWPVLGYTVDVMRMLHDAGCRISFAFDANGSMDLTDQGYREFATVLPLTSRHGDLESYCRHIVKAIAGKQVTHIIGVEKLGVIIAARVAEKTALPFSYQNLELYVEDHPGIAAHREIRPLEIQAHAKAAGTIIADEERYQVLARYNKLPDGLPVFYLPIGCLGAPRFDWSGFWNKKQSPDEFPRVVLYYGVLAKHRFADALADIAPELSRLNATLVLQGALFDPQTRTDITARHGGKPYLTLSTTRLSEEQVWDSIRGCHIGIALYERSYANDRLTAFSSHKIAQFLKCGRPIIVFRTSSTEQLMKRFQCGVMIESVPEVPSAVERILGRYEHYRDQALGAYSAIYRMDAHAADLLGFLRGSSAVPAAADLTFKQLPVFSNPRWAHHLSLVEVAGRKAGQTISGDNFRFVKKVAIELSNVCNYSGIHRQCPLHRLKQPNRVLGMDLIRKILEELSQYGYGGQLAFNIYNEPFLDPRLFSILELAKALCPDCRLSLTTNGSTLDQTLIDELDRLGVSLLFISAYSKPEYRRFVAYDYRGIGVRIEPMTLDDRLDIYDRQPLKCANPCSAPLGDLSINCRGEIQICCLDWRRTQVFGDVARESIASIVNSDRVNDVVRDLSRGNRVLPICQRCTWSR